MKKLIIFAAALVAISLAGYLATVRISALLAQNESVPQIQSQALESPKGEIIYLESPRPGEKISSPLVVKGRARGSWFFEASFPLILADWDGRIIAQGYAQAQSEWMTAEYVPFLGTLIFENPGWDAKFSKRGSLILQKDNPSGLPEHNDAAELTIYFQ